jgi:hypothetical protein
LCCSVSQGTGIIGAANYLKPTRAEKIAKGIFNIDTALDNLEKFYTGNVNRK